MKVFAKQRINKEIKNIEWLLVNLCLSNRARIQLQWERFLQQERWEGTRTLWFNKNPMRIPRKTEAWSQTMTTMLMVISFMSDFQYKNDMQAITFFTLIRLRGTPPEVFLRKGVLKICIKFTGEHRCWNVIPIKLQSNFIEITFQHGCSLVNVIHIFRTHLPKNTSGRPPNTFQAH